MDFNCYFTPDIESQILIKAKTLKLLNSGYWKLITGYWESNKHISVLQAQFKEY